MSGIIRMALSIIFVGASSVIASTIITGEKFTPTREQCLDALSSGIVIPYSDPIASKARGTATVYSYYRDNLFLVAFEAKTGTILCYAWVM
jgi:hypothetical protein